jgi:Mn2+/Fe2+ NRAMP family transporter
MCARIGMVTGRGLGSALGLKFPRWLLVLASFGLLTANTINVGADLSGMADAGEMLTGFNSHIFVVLFGVGIGLATIYFRYYQIAMILKWLALFLFAYVIAAFVTISPYLFYWQSSQEVEREKAKGRRVLVQREGATKREIIDRKLDVGIGTFFSNLVMYFIILTTALTLHAHGIKDIETSKQAAEALKPLAGSLAYTLYTVGLIGVGLLAIPTLTGSAAYAFAETFKWREGLDERFKGARSFYGVVILSTVLGIAMDYLGVNPVKALFWTAIINGLLAPPLLVGILLVACDHKLMNGQPSSMLSRVVVAAITLMMFGAAAAMFTL